MNYLFAFDLKKKEIIKNSNLPVIKKLNDAYMGSCKYSFISKAMLNENEFLAEADFWGINTHYWYIDENIFVCSDSVNEVISYVKNIQLSNTDILDVLFFGFPSSGRTIFRDINRLKASETLEFNFSDSKVKIAQIISLDQYFYKTKRKELSEDQLIKILNANFDNLNLQNPKIALSAGSDSRTILASLLHYGETPVAVTFGDERSLELKDVERLCRRFNIELEKINARMEPENYIAVLETYTKHANYLVTGQTIHIANIFDKNLGNQSAHIFLGFLGSEFIKGVLSELIVSYPLQDLISEKSIKQIIETRFGYLKTNVKKELEDYIVHKIIPKYFISKDKNYSLFRYCLYNLPSTVFGGPINLGQYQGYNVFLPYLSKTILEYAFSTGYGVLHNNNLMKNMSQRKSFLFQAQWVRLMSSRFYYSMIPQYGGSFFDICYLPKKIRSGRARLHKLIGKYIYNKPFSGQIERKYLIDCKKDYIKSNYNTSIISVLLNVDYIDKLNRIELDNLCHIMVCEKAIHESL